MYKCGLYYRTAHTHTYAIQVVGVHAFVETLYTRLHTICTIEILGKRILLGKTVMPYFQ